MQNQEIKFIKLPNGNTLEMTVYSGFLEKIAEHFELSNSSQVEDEHIKMYVWGAFKTALDKSEAMEHVHTVA